jgi:hypothetical protein
MTFIRKIYIDHCKAIYYYCFDAKSKYTEVWIFWINVSTYYWKTLVTEFILRFIDKVLVLSKLCNYSRNSFCWTKLYSDIYTASYQCKSNYYFLRCKIKSIRRCRSWVTYQLGFGNRRFILRFIDKKCWRWKCPANYAIGRNSFTELKLRWHFVSILYQSKSYSF